MDPGDRWRRRAVRFRTRGAPCRSKRIPTAAVIYLGSGAGVTNWHQRGSLRIWFTDEAIEAWKDEPRTTRGGQSDYSAPAILTALIPACRVPPGIPADQGPDRLRH